MKIIGETILNQTKFLVFKTISYLNKKGDSCRWDMVSRVNGRNAVMIVPYFGDKLVVTREFRVPIGDYEYGFPAGLIDDNETIEHAAIREMKEETGLDVIEVLKVSPPVYNSAGLTDEAISILYAKVGGKPSKLGLKNSEEIDVMIMDREQISQLLADNSKKIGAKAWIVFYQFINNKPFNG